MEHMTVAQFVPVVIAYMLAFVRLINAARFFWAWMPKWLQIILPGILASVPMMVQQMTSSQTWMDVACNFVMIFGAIGTAVKGSLPTETKNDDEN